MSIRERFQGIRDTLSLMWDWLLWHVLPGYWYHKLPDLCRQPGCGRQGVRGNENIVNGEIMCDYCHAKKHLSGQLRS